MRKLTIFMFVIMPLLLAMAIDNPKGAGHLAQVIITDGAALLGGVSHFIANLGSH
jgi:hypothetical protein